MGAYLLPPASQPVLDVLALTGSELRKTLHFRLQSASLRRDGFFVLQVTSGYRMVILHYYGISIGMALGLVKLRSFRDLGMTSAN